MSEQSNEAPIPEPIKLSGKVVSIIGFVLLLFLAYFTYYVAPHMVTPYFEKRPEETQAHFDALEEALLAYHSDHDAVPPEVYLLDYRRNNKNLFRSRTPGMSTYNVAMLTTPVSYITRDDLFDPFAIPAQFCPFTYTLVTLDTGEQGAVITSAGPNLIYDIRPWMIKDGSSAEAINALLQEMAYDPAEGRKSTGDFARLVIFPELTE